MHWHQTVQVFRTLRFIQSSSSHLFFTVCQLGPSADSSFRASRILRWKIKLEQFRKQIVFHLCFHQPAPVAPPLQFLFPNSAEYITDVWLKRFFLQEIEEFLSLCRLWTRRDSFQVRHHHFFVSFSAHPIYPILQPLRPICPIPPSCFLRPICLSHPLICFIHPICFIHLVFPNMDRDTLQNSSHLGSWTQMDEALSIMYEVLRLLF